MKFFTLCPVRLLALLTLPALTTAPPPASAQITLTPVGPATRPMTSAPRSAADPAPSADLPAGWREIRGTLQFGPGRPLPALPPGTLAVVTIRDSTRPDTPLVRVSFPVRRLPTPYWLNFNPVRLQSGRSYTVQAVLTTPAGVTLWRAQAPLPGTPRALLPLTLR